MAWQMADIAPTDQSARSGSLQPAASEEEPGLGDLHINDIGGAPGLQDPSRHLSHAQSGGAPGPQHGYEGMPSNNRPHQSQPGSSPALPPSAPPSACSFGHGGDNQAPYQQPPPPSGGQRFTVLQHCAALYSPPAQAAQQQHTMLYALQARASVGGVMWAVTLACHRRRHSRAPSRLPPRQTSSRRGMRWRPAMRRAAACCTTHSMSRSLCAAPSPRSTGKVRLLAQSCCGAFRSCVDLEHVCDGSPVLSKQGGDC